MPPSTESGTVAGSPIMQSLHFNVSSRAAVLRYERCTLSAIRIISSAACTPLAVHTKCRYDADD
jgi:hypothetical protein